MVLFLVHLRRLSRIKHVLTALLFFLQDVNRQNPLRTSGKMKGNTALSQLLNIIHVKL